MPSGAHEYYQTLGVSRTASAGEIRKAHRKLARRYHPDFNPGDKSAEERFKKVQEAYETLIDSGARRIYDEATFKPEPSRPAAPDPRSFEHRPRPRWEPSGSASMRASNAWHRPPDVSGKFGIMLGVLIGCTVLVFVGVERGLWSLTLPPDLGLDGLSVLMPLWALFIVGLVCGRTQGSFLVGSTLINAIVWSGLIIYCRGVLSIPWLDIVKMWPWVLPTQLVVVVGARIRRGTPG